jgi:hypothetical protein
MFTTDDKFIRKFCRRYRHVQEDLGTDGITLKVVLKKLDNDYLKWIHVAQGGAEWQAIMDLPGS